MNILQAKLKRGGGEKEQRGFTPLPLFPLSPFLLCCHACNQTFRTT